MQKQSFDLHELFQYILLEAHAAWRYRWHALVVAWCVAIVGAVLVFGIPNKYQVNSQVYADTTALTNPLLRGVAVQQDVRGRLQIITHTLLSRPNLESVADKTGLSLRASTPTDKIDLLDELGASVKISDAGAKNLYNISYSDVDGKMAQKVVQAFVQILMNETLGADTASTVTAQNFLRQQVQQYSERLDKAEKDLAAFKKANIGFVPGAAGGGFSSRLEQARTQLESLEGQYDTALARQSMVSRQMRSMANNPGSSGIDPRVQDIDAQIAANRKRLNALLLRYTDAYPDVVTTRRMIKQLEERRKDIRQGMSDTSLAGVTTDNPVFQERQKNFYDAQVGTRMLANQIAQQKQLIAELEGKQAKTLDVQTTMQRLTRNYTTTKQQYDELVKRLNTAQLSQAATQSGNNLKFQVVNPPVVPLEPTSPKRGLLLLVVFVFAIGMGGAFAWFMHKIKPVFSSLKSLRDFSDFPVMGAFHLIESQLRRAGRRRQIVEFSTGVGLLAVVMVLGFAFNGPLANVVQQVFVVGVS